MISIHAPLTRCDARVSSFQRPIYISIHAPLTRCDGLHFFTPSTKSYFNPRTSYEVRPLMRQHDKEVVIFQSTHLLRGATGDDGTRLSLPGFQSTHLLRGATGRSDSRLHALRNFNPRTSYEVRLACSFVPMIIPPHFNPRTSYEVRRIKSATLRASFFISIHAPLTRCDMKVVSKRLQRVYFNPRTSYEVRRIPASGRASWSGFQSTHLLRGATIGLIQSISTRVFQSTHLLRGATRIEIAENALPMISIHAPLTRCDSTCP